MRTNSWTNNKIDLFLVDALMERVALRTVSCNSKEVLMNYKTKVIWRYPESQLTREFLVSIWKSLRAVSDARIAHYNERRNMSMTNMQLAFSQYLEDARHNRVAEETSRRDVDEKVRHNLESENLTANQTAVQKYLGELQNSTKQQEILTNAEVQKLKIATDKAIADAKQNLSEREYKTAVKKADAEIAKLQANTAESVQATQRSKQLTPAEEEKLRAEANYRNAKALGSISGIVGATLGSVKTKADQADAILNPVKAEAGKFAAKKALEAADRLKSAEEKALRKATGTYNAGHRR